MKPKREKKAKTADIEMILRDHMRGRKSIHRALEENIHITGFTERDGVRCAELECFGNVPNPQPVEGFAKLERDAVAVFNAAFPAYERMRPGFDFTDFTTNFILNRTPLVEMVDIREMGYSISHRERAAYTASVFILYQRGDIGAFLQKYYVQSGMGNTTVAGLKLHERDYSSDPRRRIVGLIDMLSVMIQTCVKAYILELLRKHGELPPSPEEAERAKGMVPYADSEELAEKFGDRSASAPRSSVTETLGGIPTHSASGGKRGEFAEPERVAEMREMLEELSSSENGRAPHGMAKLIRDLMREIRENPESVPAEDAERLRALIELHMGETPARMTRGASKKLKEDMKKELSELKAKVGKKRMRTG